ncbi:MAG: lasso RiPP family leader peptide-containing protein [Pseudomonadota bacterium]
MKPTVEKLGSFESVTKGNGTGSNFDFDFSSGNPVPFDQNGNPLIFS